MGRHGSATEWSSTEGQGARSFICGWCRHQVGSDLGWCTILTRDEKIEHVEVRVCVGCGYPNILIGTDLWPRQMPPLPANHAVPGLPDDIGTIYQEMRAAQAARLCNSVVLLARKLLLHIARDKGMAPQKGGEFQACVEFLTDSVLPALKTGTEILTDHLKRLGNTASHERRVFDEGEADFALQCANSTLCLVYDVRPVLRWEEPFVS